MSNDYKIDFDLSTYKELDKLALLADQDYNLGSRGDWFNHFRGGIYGLYARVQGVQINHYAIHAWALPSLFTSRIQMAEYYLSSILFNMDSAIECMVFGLNALGFIADSKQFKDVTNEKELANISPCNILGKPPEYTTGTVQGYDTYFPTLKNCWHQSRGLIHTIFELHDVSKHRSVIFSGGTIRNDPPPGFFEQLGIAGDKVLQSLVSPMSEIILTHQPKTPWRQRKPCDYKDIDKLEDIAERFCTFINICGQKALEGAKSNIKLNYYEFQKMTTS